MVKIAQKPAKGRLTSAFRAATLANLHVAFVMAAETVEEKMNAAIAINRLYQAADKLTVRESAFNARARNATHSIVDHLRDHSHFSALREFKHAAAHVLDINIALGHKIVSLIETIIDAGARPAVPRATPAPTR